MSLLLAVYTENAHTDILLPLINNADFTVVLSKTQFDIAHNLPLELEILDNRWQFKKARRFQLEKNGEAWFEKPLRCGDILFLTCGDERFTVFVTNQSGRMGAYQKIETAGLSELTVGKEITSDICYSVGDVVSRHHMTVFFRYGRASVEDCSVNGVYINGRRIRESTELQFGDIISIFGLKLVYLTDILAVNTEDSGAVIHERLEPCCRKPDPDRCFEEKDPTEQEQTQVLFHRAPRKMVTLHTEPEEIEGPPQKLNTSSKPIWMVIGPSFTMAIPMLLGTAFMIVARNMTGTSGNVFMYMGLVTALASAVIGVSWALINLNYSRKEEKEGELLRIQKYSEYLMECAERIRGKYEHNRRALMDLYPDGRTCCDFYNNSQELWNRNRSHEDFMSYRLGLGDIPFQVPISVPVKRFTLIEDGLAERAREIKETYATLLQVPINVDLYTHRVVGIIGKGRSDVARTIVTQIAANNCYTDVRMAMLGDGSTDADWTFMKWLPHVWNSERTQRYVALERSEVSGVCHELAGIFRARKEEAENASTRKAVRPVQYVVVVESCGILESEAISKYLFDQPETIGVTTLLMTEKYEELPNSCDYIIENTASFSGMYSMVPNREKPRKINFDYVSESSIEHFARKISGVRVVETGNGTELAESLTFMEMMGVQRVEQLDVLDNWRKNRTYQTMQAMIGWKAGNIPCYLNIHEKHHGPHGLIAGTTGSGKSETLQTYILSLAINYSPMDVGFFIIDFKGGGMANLFTGLPHLLGTISNLSGSQVHRAMVSIKSENMRRQRIFNEYGVNHIDAYTKLFKSGEAGQPIPHLFIIIDEFAELKREQSEFMHELISVAQVGRSLGVHLILSTQKPSGTVDENIWSNTKFKLCLRVADKQDSKDMLHKTDAAYLTQAGRCYLQVGNDEIYELFQSGWSGAPYDEDEGTVKNNYAVQLENSGKVVMTGGTAKAKKLAVRKKQWIGQLVRCCVRAKKADSTNWLDEVFVLLRDENADYQDNVYNRSQIKDFAEHFQEYFTLEPSRAAEQILHRAQAEGRKLPEKKEKTQLDVVVEYLSALARDNGYQYSLKLWLPVLPKNLLLEDIGSKNREWIQNWDHPPFKNTLQATIGLVDDPQNQAQFPLIIDFLQDGHMAVCGAVSSGKSVLMQTIAYSLIRSHTPDMLHIYAVDYSSQMLAPFEKLPHTGGIVYEGEADKISKLFLLMGRILRERKAMFRGGSFLQYISSHGNVAPAVLLMIDGYSSFREKTDNVYESQLLELARDGAGLGIFLCISSGGFGTGEIPAKLGDKIRRVLCLEMDSKYSYGDCLRTMNFDVLPESGIRGRGLVQYHETVLEYQTALAVPGDDYRRSEAIADCCVDIDRRWNGGRACPIPQIPQNPDWVQFSALEEYKALVRTDRYLPLAYYGKDASVYAVDLSKTYCYHISGRERAGKSVFLRNVACAAKDRGGRVIIVDRIGQMTEKRTANLVDAEYVNSCDGLFRLWEEIILTTNKRHVLYKQLIQQGLEDDEIYVKMSTFQQIFVLIADLPDFISGCTDSGNGHPSMGASAENIIAKGALHQVFFFGAITNQAIAPASVQGIYRAFVKDKQGVHLAGELNSQKLLSYRNIPFAEQGKAMKPGTGYVPNEEDSVCVDEIVIPMNKGAKPIGDGEALHQGENT